MIKTIIKETLRWTVMIICLAIMGWFIWCGILGFSQADVPENYTPGEAIPYR